MKRNPLSPETAAAHLPVYRPADLVGALQEPIHEEFTVGRVPKVVREEIMQIQIIDDELYPDPPGYAYPGDAGIDLKARHSITLLHKYPMPVGIIAAIPVGYVGMLFMRSGWAKKGVVLAIPTGIIDSGYRGEIVAWLWNAHAQAPVEISRGDRIVQLLVVPCPQMKIEVCAELPNSERGANGFGSTGR